MFVGRRKELAQLKGMINNNNSVFTVVYGRRRIGKTELIRYFCQQEKIPLIEITGKIGLTKKQQIASFVEKIKRQKKIKTEAKIKDWGDAFYFLQDYLDTNRTTQKKIIFLDELPWMDTAKSGFIGELADFWNNYCSKRNDLILIVCGSAASYMLKYIIHNKGPLHGRLTHKIPMNQFDLKTTKELLLAKGCKYSNKSIVDLYMVFGGVAKYLSLISSEKTPSENIHDICFDSAGLLVHEYADLYSSLFKNSKMHFEIMNKLSEKWTGYTQKELSKQINISSSYIKIPLQELVISGFITINTKFNQLKRERVYRGMDCYSYFFNKWMASSTQRRWDNIISSQSYKSWSGFAFENICHMHIDKIKQILGISGVDTACHYWNYIPLNTEHGEKGAQIDLMLEHLGGSKNIDLIECKYSNSEFEITKKYHQELISKLEIFNSQTKGRFNTRLIFITPYGVKKNQYYNDLVNKNIKLDSFFNE